MASKPLTYDDPSNPCDHKPQDSCHLTSPWLRHGDRGRDSRIPLFSCVVSTWTVSLSTSRGNPHSGFRERLLLSQVGSGVPTSFIGLWTYVWVMQFSIRCTAVPTQFHTKPSEGRAMQCSPVDPGNPSPPKNITLPKTVMWPSSHFLLPSHPPSFLEESSTVYNQYHYLEFFLDIKTLF